MADMAPQFSADRFPVTCDLPTPVDISFIMQPKFLTSASYDFGKIHKDIFVHIREELQVFLSKKQEDFLERAEIQVPLFIKDYPHFDGKPKQFYDYVLDMAQKKNFISFAYCYSDGMSSFLRRLFGLDGIRMKVKDGDTLHMSVAVITGAKYSSGDQDCLMVSINRAAVPFLLYYGPGAGGMYFDRDVSLGFSHAKTSRIYEWLLEWGKDGEVYRMPLSEFKSRLCLKKSYCHLSNIRKHILDVAVSEINSSRSEVRFTYSFEFDLSLPLESDSVSKKAYNVIVFRMEKVSREKEARVFRQALWVCLQDIADKECAGNCREAVDLAVRKGVDYRLRMKFGYYTKRLRDGSIRRDEYVNTMLKIVRDMVGVDLRSVQHIRNAKLSSSRRMTRISREPELVSDTLF